MSRQCIMTLFGWCLMAPLLPITIAKMPDWIISKVPTTTELQKLPNGIRLTNGFIHRDFTIRPDFSTVDFYSHEKQSSLLRAINPEVLLSLDGLVYPVGGLKTTIPRAYLNRTALATDMNIDEDAFHFVDYKTHVPEVPFQYVPRRGAPKGISWPPKGLRLDVRFKAPAWAPMYHKEVSVTVHYEMYDGIPLLAKWVTLEAGIFAQGEVLFEIHSVEYLAVNKPWSGRDGNSWFFVQTDRAHGTNVRWSLDPNQGAMPGSFEDVVNCTYSMAPKLLMKPVFTSFKVRELVIASSDPERIGLAKRKMLRLLAPHTQENPIFFHMTDADNKSIHTLIDQMADVGFEMLIYSFGSGFNIESTNKSYLSEIAEVVRYANSKNIEVGGYDLIALTRRVKKEWMSIGARSASACFASGWYDFLLKRVLNFIDKTGISFIESDGPYGGYTCSSSNHSHHVGYQDSVYMQDLLQGEFYLELRRRQVYINQPDNYFYQGGSKTGMGYNEHQYSLPRWQDLSVSRQGMYDDTYHYTPTIGWMFVPLIMYHGGGTAAIFEPLSAHKVEYSWALAQYLGAGVAACYRGTRLFDSEDTKTIVKTWVSFYKKYRGILTSDIIHIRRADMQSIDSYMHVNPFLVHQGLAMAFNPTHDVQSMNLTLFLYYTGIKQMAQVSQEDGPFKQYPLDRSYNIDVYVKLQPLQITWFVIHDGKK